MLPYTYPGFYVLQKDDTFAKIRFLRYYPSLDRLVRVEIFGWNAKGHRADFADGFDVRINYSPDYPEFLWDNELTFGAYAKVVVDQDENVVPVCELRRVYNEINNDRCYYRFRHRYRKSAYGTFRHPRTTQEKRAYYDTLDQEVPIKVRGRRKPRQLPDTWDDYYAHSDKSWKTQSKSRHQWKDRV